MSLLNMQWVYLLQRCLVCERFFKECSMRTSSIIHIGTTLRLDMHAVAYICYHELSNGGTLEDDR